jgi:hypothetical protein
MPKALTIGGMVVSAVLLLLFGMDLAVGIPFQGISKLMDIGVVICALMLGYMSWTTLRELR